MTKERFTSLLQQYLKNQLSATDLDEFLDAVKQEEFRQEMQEQLNNDLNFSSFEKADDVEWALASYTNFRKLISEPKAYPAVHRVHLLKAAWFRYAAAVVIAAGIAAYLWLGSNSKPEDLTKTIASTDLLTRPKDAIILTLSNGERMILDSLGNGVIANENGTTILLKEGQIAYNSSNGRVTKVGYNTMATPKGRQFQITLPDDTKVWLNAESSIRYPTVFAGKERRVEITGEVYFEVAKNEKMPFRVKAGDNAEVEVLGTSFNVNSYSNEPELKTTLLSGSVRIKVQDQSQILKPGQQLRLNAENDMTVISNANIDHVVAWKNGYFDFADADIFEVTRQLQRWYEIDIIFNKSVKPGKYNGQIQRDLSFSQILKILSEMQIRYRLNGNKLVIEP